MRSSRSIRNMQFQGDGNIFCQYFIFVFQEIVRKVCKESVRCIITIFEAQLPSSRFFQVLSRQSLLFFIIYSRYLAFFLGEHLCLIWQLIFFAIQSQYFLTCDLQKHRLHLRLSSFSEIISHRSTFVRLCTSTFHILSSSFLILAIKVHMIFSRS